MFRLLIVAIVSFGCFGCSTGSQKITQTPPPPYTEPVEYKIGVGDSLSISVWKSPEFTSTIPVRPDGKISIPLVGDVTASGKSSESLAKDIASKLTTYIRNPQVTVIVADAKSTEYLASIRITGAVTSPTSVVYKEGLTVLDLVLQAGGLTYRAAGNKATLYRKVNGKVEPFPVNINDILYKGNIETNYLLAPSDILTVPF